MKKKKTGTDSCNGSSCRFRTTTVDSGDADVYVYKFYYSKTIMEYLVSRQEINDTRYSIYERCATFERNLALTDNRLVKLDVVQEVFKDISKRVILVDWMFTSAYKRGNQRRSRHQVSHVPLQDRSAGQDLAVVR